MGLLQKVEYDEDVTGEEVDNNPKGSILSLKESNQRLLTSPVDEEGVDEFVGEEDTDDPEKRLGIVVDEVGVEQDDVVDKINLGRLEDLSLFPFSLAGHFMLLFPLLLCC